MNVTRENWTSAIAPTQAMPGRGPASAGRAKELAVAYIVLIAAIVALDTLSYVAPLGPIPVTPWNPQAGLAIAATVAAGAVLAPAVLAATVLAEIIRPGGTPLFDLLGGLVLGALYIVMGLAFRARSAGRPVMRMQSLQNFLLISLVGTAVAAALYVACFAATSGIGGPPLASSVLHKWLGDSMGALAIAPMLLTLADPRGRRSYGRHPGVDALLAAFAVAGLYALAFTYQPANAQHLLYLLFVPMIYVAMRHGFIGAALGVAAVQIGLIGALRVSGASPAAASEFQLLMLVLSVTTLLLGSVAHERRRALAKLARRSAELRVQQSAVAHALRVAAASETACTLAHEMSQPLSAIGTYARTGSEMLRRGLAADLGSILERIEHETQRSSEVVRRIRDFFRTGFARREPCEAGAIIHNAIAGVNDRLANERIALAIDLPADLPHVSADPVQIGTALHILLSNAIDAASDAGRPRRIRLAARTSGDAEVEIDVEDSGPGIAEPIVSELFEPLATTKPGGMGLGLAICRTIVQAHGGRLWLARSEPTTFRFTLPIHGQDD